MDTKERQETFQHALIRTRYNHLTALAEKHIAKHCPNRGINAGIIALKTFAETPIIAWFDNEERIFFIRVHPEINNTDTFYEASAVRIPEQYNGEYTIITNNDRLTAVWAQGFCEVQIQGDLTYEELTAMLDSIP